MHEAVMMKHLTLALSFLTQLVLMAAWPAHAASLKYRVDVIGDRDTRSSALNNRGELTGSIGNFRTPTPFVYGGGNLQTLGLPDAAHGVGVDINDRGEIAGYYWRTIGQESAFLYQNGVVKEIGADLPGTRRFAYGINSQGHAIGAVDEKPFIYDGNSSRYLEHNGSPLNAEVLDINDHDVVVGALSGGDALAAFSYRNGVVTRLSDPNAGYSFATAINNAGQAVGVSRDLPVLYENGSVTSLGTLGGRTGSAWGINDQGWIVGEAQRLEGLHTAFLYRDGEMHDLNDLLWGDVAAHRRLSWARDINNAGQIVVSSFNIDRFNESRLLLLTPVPEPGSCALMLSGFGVIGLILKWRRRDAVWLELCRLPENDWARSCLSLMRSRYRLISKE
jgi:probable HAF family extracellular repeat protein